MNVNENVEFGYKIRQLLNQGAETLDSDSNVVTRLHQARRTALDHRQTRTSGARLAGIGSIVDHSFFCHARSFLMIAALGLGALGIYYWNGFEQAQEHEEIDSALLADELPPSAYLDPGFQAWLESTSHSSSPQN